jgi:maleate isomerase
MTDALGYRRKFAVLVPSTNTIVEPDLYRMSVPGVTSHIERIHIRNMQMDSDDMMLNLLEQIRAEMKAACERVMTCEPDYMVMGMSAETFWGGKSGNTEFKALIKEYSGLDVATGADACEKALACYDVKRIGVVTPYQSVGDEQVRIFFEDLGYEVVHIEGLKRPTAVSIAHTAEKELRDALVKMNGMGVDALVQAGTNLSMVQLADEAERWLEKPVIAINAATWWLALRENGIEDKVYGAGSLLRHF